MSHLSIFFISSNTIPFLLVHFTFSYILCEFLLSIALPHGHICANYFLLPATGIPLSSLWQVQLPYTNSQFRRFRELHWAVRIRFHFYPSAPPPVYLEGGGGLDTAVHR